MSSFHMSNKVSTRFISEIIRWRHLHFCNKPSQSRSNIVCTAPTVALHDWPVDHLWLLVSPELHLFLGSLLAYIRLQYRLSLGPIRLPELSKAVSLNVSRSRQSCYSYQTILNPRRPPRQYTSEQDSVVSMYVFAISTFLPSADASELTGTGTNCVSSITVIHQ